MEKYQELNPFKFILYSDRISEETRRMETQMQPSEAPRQPIELTACWIATSEIRFERFLASALRS
jgi:hypothetical protein